MKLRMSPTAQVFDNFKTMKNPRTRFCAAIGGTISVGDFVCVKKDKNATSLQDDGANQTRLLQEFRGCDTFGQVTNLYECDGNEDEVMLDMNLYLKRETLSASLGRFNSRVPQECMLVQTDMSVIGCALCNVAGCVMAIHMDSHDRLMEGLLGVLFVDSVYEPTALRLRTKDSKFHFRSSSDLFRNNHPGFVSQPELQFNQLVKVQDAVCKMLCRVASSQPRTNRVHVDMSPSVWLMVMDFLKMQTAESLVPIYHDHDTKVSTVKRGVSVTSDKRIEMITVERIIEDHHKFDRLVVYTREHIALLQCIFGVFFGIGARLRHPKPKSEEEPRAKKKARTTPPPDNQPQSSDDATKTPAVCSIVTAPVTFDVRLNTLTQLPTETMVSKRVSAFVKRKLEGVALVYDWAAHCLTVRVGYNTPIFSLAKNDLFAVFKFILDDPSEEDSNYPEKGKHFFVGPVMHDVLLYHGGNTVKVAPSNHHAESFTICQAECRTLIGEFYDKLCGSSDSDETSSASASVSASDVSNLSAVAIGGTFPSDL